MSTLLISPVLKLTSYRDSGVEVFISCWVLCETELDEMFPLGGDGLLLALFNRMTGELNPLSLPGKGVNSGEGNKEPGTEDGWHRILLRFPATLRKNGLPFVFLFVRDRDGQKGGVYVDSLRIYPTWGIDLSPVSDNPLSSRQWSLRNVGQITWGEGGDRVFDAWAQVDVVPDLLVPVVDLGVCLDHPDLVTLPG